MNFSVTAEDYTMTATIQVIGKDVLIEITGGDVPHIGTVTTLTADTKIQTIKYLSHDGRLHKDGVLAERVAQIIQTSLPASCTITSGVHVDYITKKQIFASDKMAYDLGLKIKDWLNHHDFSSKAPIYYAKNDKPL